MKHILFNSGGIGSWTAGMRIAEQHGSDNIIHLFTDTKMEDEDLYRFLYEGAELIGGKMEHIEEGRDIWQVFEDVRYMGNSRVDPCSRVLKRELSRKWIEERFKPDDCILYLGIDWSESHRSVRNERFWEPYKTEFPMIEEPYLNKEEMCQWAESLGVKRPRLYEMGFSHNNCGGFCVKAGQAQFYNLLKTMPERYAYHEQKQEELFEHLGKRHGFIRKTIDGKLHFLGLKEFREMVEQDEQIDMFDHGACGCFVDTY